MCCMYVLICVLLNVVCFGNEPLLVCAYGVVTTILFVCIFDVLSVCGVGPGFDSTSPLL